MYVDIVISNVFNVNKLFFFHIQGLMVWHSRSRLCILTAIKSHHNNKLHLTILVLYINYSILFISKATYSNTARNYKIQVMVSILKLHSSIKYAIDLSKWGDLCIIIDYL